jgi:hypothetical protein
MCQSLFQRDSLDEDRRSRSPSVKYSKPFYAIEEGKAFTKKENPKAKFT